MLQCELSTAERLSLECWARAIDRLSPEFLDKDAGYEKVDTSHFMACPCCGEQPRAWISRHKDSGTVKCCIYGSTIVSANGDEEPVTTVGLEISWNRLVWQYNEETNHDKQ